MLVALITRLSWRVLHQTEWADCSLAEKPKTGELQMDWLRSEDLKEEKNVTTPKTIIAVYAPRRLPRSGEAYVLRVPLFRRCATKAGRC